MTVCVVVMAANEEAIISRCLASARPYVDSWCLLDTGSSDDTEQLARDTMAGLPGKVDEHKWVDFGRARTAALRAARGMADWLLMVDADQTIESHPDMNAWLDRDPNPDVDIYNVLMRDNDLSYRLPRLLRDGAADWRYVGATHEYLQNHAHARPLAGMTIVHHHDGAYRADKHERDLALLEQAVAAGEPRSVYYAAQALWGLGRLDEAAAMYERRGKLGGWEEEAWHARYMAARLRDDVLALLAVHAERPWRHEPLTHAAELVAAAGARDDILFLEATPAGQPDRISP